MKKVILAFIVLASLTATAQMPALQQVQNTAKAQHKFILLTFSGSDWCIPCIRMEKEVLEKDTFKKYAEEHLLLVKADFPRLKKHQLPVDQKKQNEQLADKYNSKGIFPLTVLLDNEGKIIKQWDGIVADSPEKFIQQLEALQHAR